MKASLTIVGIEVALSVPSGPLETIVARRYAPFLGAVEIPVRSLVVLADPALDSGRHLGEAVVDRQPDGTYRVIHPGFRILMGPDGIGSVHCAPDPGTIDHALRTVFALLAPVYGSLLVEASGVLGGGGVDIFVGGAPADDPPVDSLAGCQPVPTNAYVMLHRAADGTWLAATTPFSNSQNRPGAPREARLSRIWAQRDESDSEPSAADAQATVDLLMRIAVVPGVDEAACLAVRDLALDLAAVVPLSALVTPVALIDKRPQFA